MSIASKMPIEEIEKRSTVQKRGKYGSSPVVVIPSAQSNKVSTRKENHTNKQLSLFDA